MENNPDEFQRLAGLARSLPGDYGRGYSRGVRRRFYGERFCTEEEHEQWMGFEGRRVDLGRGYRDAVEGREPQADAAETWTPAEVRAWVDRHGGNVTALARRLGIGRTHLQALIADRGQHQRVPSRAVQSHMRTIDELADCQERGRG